MIARLLNVAFRSAKERHFRGAKGDDVTVFFRMPLIAVDSAQGCHQLMPVHDNVKGFPFFHVVASEPLFADGDFRAKIEKALDDHRIEALLVSDPVIVVDGPEAFHDTMYHPEDRSLSILGRDNHLCRSAFDVKLCHMLKLLNIL